MASTGLLGDAKRLMTYLSAATQEEETTIIKVNLSEVQAKTLRTIYSMYTNPDYSDCSVLFYNNDSKTSHTHMLSCMSAVQGILARVKGMKDTESAQRGGGGVYHLYCDPPRATICPVIPMYTSPRTTPCVPTSFI
jgi:plasmid maintenance system killer protein